MKKIIYLTFLLLVACSGSFETLGDQSEDAQEGLSDAELKAYIQSGPFEGKQVLNDIQDSKLQIILPLGLNSFVSTGPFSSPDKQISGTVISDNFGFKSLHFSVPLSWLLQGVNRPSMAHLPNGESLTQFPGGAAPHMAFSLDEAGQNVLYLYIKPPYMGAFIQTPFDQGGSRQYPVTYGTSFLDMGRFSTHPHRLPFNGGLFLFISLPQ